MIWFRVLGVSVMRGPKFAESFTTIYACLDRHSFVCVRVAPLAQNTFRARTLQLLYDAETPLITRKTKGEATTTVAESSKMIKVATACICRLCVLHDVWAPVSTPG